MPVTHTRPTLTPDGRRIGGPTVINHNHTTIINNTYINNTTIVNQTFVHQRRINNPYWGHYGGYYGCHRWDGYRDWLTVEIAYGIWIDLVWERNYPHPYYYYNNCRWDYWNGYYRCYRGTRIIVMDSGRYYDYRYYGGTVVLVPTNDLVSETPVPVPEPEAPASTKRMYYSDDETRSVRIHDTDNKAALYDRTRKDPDGNDVFLANLTNYVIADQPEAGVQGVKFLPIAATDENGLPLRNADGSLQLTLLVEVRHEVSVNGEVRVQVDQYDAWGNLWQTVPDQHGTPPLRQSAEEKGMKYPSSLRLETPAEGRFYDSRGAR